MTEKNYGTAAGEIDEVGFVDLEDEFSAEFVAPATLPANSKFIGTYKGIVPKLGKYKADGYKFEDSDGKTTIFFGCSAFNQKLPNVEPETEVMITALGKKETKKGNTFYDFNFKIKPRG